MQNSHHYLMLLKEITVLYVEDDLDTQEIISEILKSFCKDVKLASNPEEALILYQENKIDLIISDIEMPKLNGIDFIKKIREDDIRTSVIMLSAYSTQEYLLSSINLKIDAYILKPVSYSKIKDALFRSARAMSETKNIYVKLSENLFYDGINSCLIDEDRRIDLQKKEKIFMDLLVQNREDLVSYELIEQSLWNNFNNVMTQNALRTVVKKLRNKSDTNFIENVSGCGYRLKDNIV